MDNIKQICVELANLAKREHYFCEDSWYSCPKAEGGCANDAEGDECTCGADAHNAKVNELLAAALVEPKVPTDEELLEINDGAYCPGTDEVNDEDDSSWQYTSDYIRWLDENGTPEEQAAYTAKGLRAVFEAGRRWGRPAPNPVPVSERLPGPKDCDAEGMCWWYCAPAERWLRCGIPEPNPASQVHTHWLPAHALPQPS